MSLEAPQKPLIWNFSPEDIIRKTKNVIEHCKSIEDRVAALNPQDCTFESVFLQLAKAETDLYLTEHLEFFKHVSPDRKLRDAANEACKLSCNFDVESRMRVDVHNAKKHAMANIEAQGIHLSAEEKRLAEKMVLQGKREGLDLTEDKRNVLIEKNKRLDALYIEFDRNYDEEKGTMTFTEKELEGVPNDVLAGYQKHVDGYRTTYTITHKDTDYFPLIENARDPETRKRAVFSYESRMAKNSPLLAQISQLRREIASILGYPSWGDFEAETRFVRSLEKAKHFLDHLEGVKRQTGLVNRTVLLCIKEKEHKELGYPFNGVFYLWDYWYYTRKYRMEVLALDDSYVMQFFPVSHVINAALKEYEHLFGVRFERVQAQTWHADVETFAVWNADATDKSGFLGYCYLDLFTRNDKYPGNCVWTLLPGYELPDRGRNYPVAALIANLAKSNSKSDLENRSTLLRHKEVVGLFHEMGHVFHVLLSRTRFARFHGTLNVARDFVEVPSQLLENWCWEPKVLKQISMHFESGDAIPDDIIYKLNKSRSANDGLKYLREIFLAKYDLEVHGDKAMGNLTGRWMELLEKVSLLKVHEKPAPGEGGFWHIANGGYPAGYYGYLYSKYIMRNMYEHGFKGNLLDPELLRKYREEILLPGSSRDESESLTRFLGAPHIL